MIESFSFKKTALFLLLTATAFFQVADVSAQIADRESLIWEAIAEENIAARGPRYLEPEKYRTFRLDQNELVNVLNSAPLEFSDQSKGSPVTLSVPTPDGTLVQFRLEESPILAPHIASQFPGWKTYQGHGIDDPRVTARFSWTDRGFHGYVLDPSGTYSIEPYQANDNVNYIVFRKSEFGNPPRNFHCGLDELLSQEHGHGESIFAPLFAHGTQIRTYRLAVATTFEYTTFFRQAGDTDPQAQTRAFNQVVISVNRIVGVYRKELAVSFTLVSGTNLTFITNPETPSDYANNGSSADLTANLNNVNTIIGIANYDVGHLFETGDGGVAQLASVCGSSKARGLSGLPDPTGDPFDVDYVAHELGHQFAMNHTFNASSNCGSSPIAARKEPGSAVTIMGYAGICSSVANLQRNSIDTFHVYNLTESINFLTTGAGASCGTLRGTNSVPVISPVPNYTIPYNTPFALTASATDANGDPLTYSWEQNDSGASTSNYPNTTDDDDTSLVFRPGFRPYLPTASPTRSFPSLTYILNNSNEAPITYSGLSATGSICAATCITGEDLPSAARTMNFRVTVRDGNGGISDSGTALTVVNTATPFRVTTQNSSPETWVAGQFKTITWNVSGTTASGINTANVKVSLSTNGGQTFPIVLAASTPNDGAETIIVPEVSTSQARIKVEAVGNIFFDISDTNFSITPSAIFAVSRAVSRKTHGAAGDFDVPLTLSNSLGIENRQSATTGAHTIVVTFDRQITSGDAAVTSGSGAVSAPPIISGRTMTINLTGVTDAQTLTLRLEDVTDTSAQVLPDTNLNVGFLLADVNGSGGVTASDVGAVKSLSGQPITTENFRGDINASGGITSTDISIAKSRSGAVLPAAEAANAGR